MFFPFGLFFAFALSIKQDYIYNTVYDIKLEKKRLWMVFQEEWLCYWGNNSTGLERASAIYRSFLIFNREILCTRGGYRELSFHGEI